MAQFGKGIYMSILSRGISIAIALATLASCASGIEKKVKDAERNAPNWYDDRKKDILDQGYRDFNDVPETPDRKPLLEQVEKEDADLQKEIEAFENDPKARTPQEDGLEDPGEFAKRVREEVEGGLPDS